MSTTVENEQNLTRQSEKFAHEESADFDKPAEVRVHEDHTREMVTPSFARMRTEWLGEEAGHVRALKDLADATIFELMPDAFIIMNDLFNVVRDAEYDPETGEVKTDGHGFPVWQRKPSGAYVEDWTRLGIKGREDFLMRITSHMFGWKQTSADLWGESMFAKVVYEEMLAHGYINPTGKLTVDERTHRARLSSTDQRFFAIFRTLLSRKADGVVSSMENLGQRIKDILTS